MDDIKIEKNVPYPATGKWIPAIRLLKVGESFFVDGDVGLANSVRGAAHRVRTGGRKFSVRKVDGGYRCWRVE